MIAMNGSMLMTSVEMFTPASWRAVAIDNEIPNRNEPNVRPAISYWFEIC